MTYSVKEIYYTLQGEGANAGRPAVFLRFSGCNLWSGLPEGREKGPGGCSRWCDTDFVGTNGSNGGKFSGPSELVEVVQGLGPNDDTEEGKFVVLTGGEPLLQVDRPLIEALHAAGYSIAVETNGTVEPPSGVDWLTVSPKKDATLRVFEGHELKLVFPQTGMEPQKFEEMRFKRFYLQPLDGPDRQANTELAIKYCLTHPKWRLSVQTHKYIGIP
jgi:7-carboxy-7-deazaguanine synthase